MRRTPTVSKLAKFVGLAREPLAWGAIARTRTAAAVEHLPMLRRMRPQTLIDAGANKGQFALAARLAVPGVRIFAFEPLPGEAAVFRRNLADAEGVELQMVALSDRAGRASLRVADRADSSSLLPLTPAASTAYGLHQAAPVEVELRRLDAALTADQLQGTTLLKIDVQGAEAIVIAGATGLLERIDLIYVELSFVPLYAGQPLAGEVVTLLDGHGFALRGIHNLSETAAFGATQADFLFANTRQART
jgi:FkbM family methyltransferase